MDCQKTALAQPPPPLPPWGYGFPGGTGERSVQPPARLTYLRSPAGQSRLQGERASCQLWTSENGFWVKSHSKQARVNHLPPSLLRISWALRSPPPPHPFKIREHYWLAAGAHHPLPFVSGHLPEADSYAWSQDVPLWVGFDRYMCVNRASGLSTNYLREPNKSLNKSLLKSCPSAEQNGNFLTLKEV